MEKTKAEIRISAPADLHKRLVELAKESGHRRDAMYVKALDAGCAFFERERRINNEKNLKP